MTRRAILIAGRWAETGETTSIRNPYNGEILAEVSLATNKEIEEAIENLPKSDLAELSAWFEKYEAETWDRQFEADVAAGHFDQMRIEAIADFEAGRTKPL